MIPIPDMYEPDFAERSTIIWFIFIESFDLNKEVARLLPYFLNLGMAVFEDGFFEWYVFHSDVLVNKAKDIVYLVDNNNAKLSKQLTT